MANSKADFLKKRPKSYLQKMFVSSGIHFVVVRRITFTKKMSLKDVNFLFCKTNVNVKAIAGQLGFISMITCLIIPGLD